MTAENPEPPPTGRDTARRSERLWFAAQFAASLAVVAVVLALLLFGGGAAEGEVDLAPASALFRSVEPLPPDRMRVERDSTLGRKLVVGRSEISRIETPSLRVTGTVAASLRPVGPEMTDQWQFNEPEALESFYDWRRAKVDVQFSEEQTRRMEQLNETRMASQTQIVERLRRLVEAGTDTLADLQLAEAEYLQTEIEGRADIHEAESDLRRARQEMAVAARQLQLMGLDVEMLEEASSDVDIVVGEVPEDYIARVRVGQQCVARFLGLPRKAFPGMVQRVSPTLSLERRALRVLFFVDDPDDELRPGMFADIGLGTEPRDAVLVPAAAVIHVGRDDFVLGKVAGEPQVWRLIPVEVADTREGMIEILRGIEPGEEIIVENAILLKPVAAAMVREATRGNE